MAKKSKILEKKLVEREKICFGRTDSEKMISGISMMRK